jgi:hypothetical protein
MFVPSRAGRTDRVNIVSQRWADNEAAKSVCKGCYLIIVTAFPGCDLPEQFLNMPGRKNHQHSNGHFRQIAPGMRIALAHGNCRTRRNVQSYIANDDVQRPLQDKEMLILVVVNVHRHAIARIRDYLKHGIDTLCLLGRGADLETLARRRFQPSTIVLMIDR